MSALHSERLSGFRKVGQRVSLDSTDRLLLCQKFSLSISESVFAGGRFIAMCVLFSFLAYVCGCGFKAKHLVERHNFRSFILIISSDEYIFVVEVFESICFTHTFI